MSTSKFMKIILDNLPPIKDNTFLIASSENKQMFMIVAPWTKTKKYRVEKTNGEIKMFRKLHRAIDYYNKEK